VPFWEHDHDLDSSTHNRCAGIDFGAGDVNAHSPYVYDPVIAIAHGAQSLIDAGATDVNPQNLTEHLMRNARFEGLTGPLGFLNREDYRGDRIGGIFFVMVNHDGSRSRRDSSRGAATGLVPYARPRDCLDEVSRFAWLDVA